jgi:DNA polymerase-1
MPHYGDFDPASVSWVLTRADLDHLLGCIDDATEACLDLETTGLSEHAVPAAANHGYGARVSVGSLTLPLPGLAIPTTWVLPLSHPQSPWQGRWARVLGQVCQRLVDAAVPLVNQNVKYDARWVYATTGVDLAPLIGWDPMISSHLLDENTTTRLKERAPATFGVQAWDEFDLSRPEAVETIPLLDLGMYAARDTWWAWRLACAHREQMFVGPGTDEPMATEEIETARLGRLAVWCAMPTVATLAGVEQRGIMLDADWTRAELEKRRTAERGLGFALGRRYRMPLDTMSFAATSHWFLEWAERAVAAGDLEVTQLTPRGRAAWTKGVLVRQARKGSPVADDLLALRSASKQAEFLDSWLHNVAADGAVHATYNAGRVITGRLSSDSPNMQQVTEVLKPAFVPRPGFVIADFDYSQIELRVAAHISGCEPMIAAFNDGRDLHRYLAARITSKDEADVTALERKAGKSANFGLLYGLGAYGFMLYAEEQYDVSFTISEATAIRRAFFDTWVGLADWHAHTIARAVATGQVTSPIGRVRRVPGIWDANESLAAYNERAAINSPVQGFGSDLMQIAAASIAGRLPGHEAVDGAYLVATVHDSVVAEVEADRWEQVVKACAERMLDLSDVLGRMDCRLRVPLAVDVKVGTRWGLSDVGTLTG